jgi:hypothetical protein
MPIPNPILDDRSYQQLRDELVRRIPVYNPEWTDHNPSDPGITLIELFAFLGENLLFRFNQIPEATKLAYLRLLQIPLRAANPARALITMSGEIPAGTLIPQETEARAGNLPFTTRIEVKVYPVSFVAVARLESATPDQDQEPEVHDFWLRALDTIGSLLPNHKRVPYRNETVPEDGVGLPVDFSVSVDGMIWIAVLAAKGADRSRMGGAVLNVGFIPDPVVSGMDQIDACPGKDAVSNALAVEWQASTGKFGADGQPVYRSLTVLGDTTRGLTREGVVRLRLPNDPALPTNPTGLDNFVVSDFDARGVGQLPPVLSDEQEEKILFWIRVFRLNQGRFGRVQFIGANAVEVVQYTRVAAEFLGVGNGQPNQIFKLVHRTVVEGSLVLEVEEAGRFLPWKEVPGFFASDSDDRHFVVDLEAGEVKFGNGIQGRAPQIGQRLRAVEYRYGGGAVGNVPQQAINRIPGFTVKDVQNPLRAHGGRDTEGIEAALNRIPGEFRRRDRGVTTGDFQELALATPGAQVGRAECLPRFYPPTRTPESAGVVTVVVWPQEDPKRPNAPLPDRNLLRDVCAFLDRRRLVTTELYVIPPTYKKVAVAVGLKVKDGYGVEAVRQWVELVLRQYLAPLPPYGPSGQGWPLGRRVHGPELEAVALQVEGVEFLEGLNVAWYDETDKKWLPGFVELAAYEVPELSEVTVVEGQPLTAGQVITPSIDERVLVPVPVIREVC